MARVVLVIPTYAMVGFGIERLAVWLQYGELPPSEGEFPVIAMRDCPDP